MKSLASLSVVATLAAGSAALSAQSLPLAATGFSAHAPVTYYAHLNYPYSSSSSSNSAAEFSLAAPASSAASASAGQAAPEASSKPFSGVGVDAKVGLAGIGFDVATPLVPTRLNLRGGATFFSYSLNETTSDGLNASGTLKLQNSGIMLDFFPWRGKFRISGGVTVYNNKGFNGSLDVPSGNSFTLGNDKYYASGPVVGTGNFKLGGNAGGRVSFGSGNLLPKKGRFTFQSELGIEFVSAPTVALAFSGKVCTSAQGQNCANPTNVSNFPTFQSDVVAEQAKLQNDVNFVKFYPIISFGIGYKIH